MTERPWCLHAICTESKTGRALSLSLSLYLSLALSRLLSLSGSLARSLSLSALIFGVSYEARISCAHRQLDAAWAARGATWRPVAGRTSAGLPTRRGPGMRRDLAARGRQDERRAADAQRSLGRHGSPAVPSAQLPGLRTAELRGPAPHRGVRPSPVHTV
jgi:hypothetical protein